MGIMQLSRRGNCNLWGTAAPCLSFPTVQGSLWLPDHCEPGVGHLVCPSCMAWVAHSPDLHGAEEEAAVWM